MSEEELGTSVPQDNGDAAQAPADVAETAEVPQEEEAPKSPLAEPTRQWVSLPGSSCNVRIGSGNLENFGHDLKSSVGKPAKAALLVSDKADPDFVQELLWQLNDAGFQALRGSVPGELTLSAADELFGELDRLHITSDDLIVCVGAAPELSLVLYAAGAWCGRTPVCALPLDLEALVCATVTPEGISVGTHRDMVSGHNSLKNVFADFARIDLGPSEKRLHAYATMVATAVSDTEKAFESLYNRRDALAEADEVALREQVNETLRSRGRIASSTSVAVRQSLSYGVKTLGFAQTDFLKLELAAIVFFAVFIVVGCVEADKRGRRPVLLLATFLTVVFSFFAPQLLTTQNSLAVYVFLAVGFALMGGLFGPCGAYLPELFPANVRYSGSGLAYNLASILGGAFAPTIATALVAAFGIQGVGWYLVAMSVVAFVALLMIKESKDMEFAA